MTKGSKRGDICAAVARNTDRNEEVKLVGLEDNNSVTVCSTVFGTEPTKKVRRWNRIEKKKIDVDRQHIVEHTARPWVARIVKTSMLTIIIAVEFAEKSGGLFTWLVDVSIQNAWLLGREANCKDCDNLLTFRRSIAIFYLKHYGSEPKRPRRRISNARAETELQFDRMDHFVMRNDGNARRRCALVVVEVCMFAKNAIEFFAQSALSTTTRSTKQKSSR